MPEDTALLRRYAEDRDESAFAELVQHRIDGIYSVALRRVGGDVHFASDITQQVFAALARDARRLSHHPVLTGWLYTTTRHIAANTVRGERRRKTREQEAHAMEDALSKGPAEADWNQVAPVLEGALDELGEPDRLAVWLRFFDRRSFGEVGAALGLSEDAARKRVDRALEKLRLALNRPGVSSSAYALAGALTNSAVGAAPIGLAAVATNTALAGGGGGVAATFFTMTKLQMTAAATCALAGATVFFVQVRQEAPRRAELATLRTDDRQLIALRTENIRLAALAAEVADLRRDDAELARLRDETESVKRRQAEAVRIRAERSADWVDITKVPTLELQQLDQIPMARFRTPPTYPMEMRHEGVAGEVLVEFVVDANGEIRDARARKSTRPEFEAVAIQAVSNWEYKPGEKGQGRVNARMLVPMVFTTGEPGSRGDPVSDPIFPQETGLRAFHIHADAPKPGEKPAVPPSWF